MAERSKTADNSNKGASDSPSAPRFRWIIESFSKLTNKTYSELFTVGGYEWRIVIFPKGNNVEHLSIYLQVAENSAPLPQGWSTYATVRLALLNQIHGTKSVTKELRSQFSARACSWGFRSFMPLSELYDPAGGYLVNNSVVVEAEILSCGVDPNDTGFVGLENQGGTSYLNSFLQTLYHIPCFRTAVYHMPTNASFPLALQKLFYKLHYGDSRVNTKELTMSFRWDNSDTSIQQSPQGHHRILLEKLAGKMKGTVVDGAIQNIFEGHHMNYIECLNVDKKASNKLSFYDLQLIVKGCHDVYASFDNYVEVRRLEGEYKYHDERYGLQDARNCILFIDFPPVLRLQLRRFEHGFMSDTIVKNNDPFEFPLQLDLDHENGKYLSPEADRSIRNLYTLHSVLVHSGGVHDGHFYAYIRPALSEKWYKFDDAKVTEVDMGMALKEQCGAYMLVYIRESDKEKVFCNVDEKDNDLLPKKRLKSKHVGKDKAKINSYTTVKVARDEDLAQQIGKDVYFDLVDHDKVKHFNVQKQMSFTCFKMLHHTVDHIASPGSRRPQPPYSPETREEVAKEFGIPVQFQRFWLCAERANSTYRPDRLLTLDEEEQTIGQIMEFTSQVRGAELKLFFGVDLRPVSPGQSGEDIMLFFKLYDPEREELRYVGRLFVKSTGKPSDIFSRLNEMAGYAADEDLELYEEIKFKPNVMCEHISKKLTFRASQLLDGDIVCFQRPVPAESVGKYRYVDVPSFLEHLQNRKVIHFRQRPKEDGFCLDLSEFHTYDDVVKGVARQLGLDDPSKIRLTYPHRFSRQTKTQPIEYRGIDHLSDMLDHHNKSSDVLYYEVLDIPMPETEAQKTLKVAFHHAEKVTIYTISLPKQSTVGDLLNDLRSKVKKLNNESGDLVDLHPSAELRLFQVCHHKIHKVFPPDEKIENVNDQLSALRAEEVPDEEKNLGLHDKLVHVHHFTMETVRNETVRNLGDPFFFVIHEGEALADVKVRIQKKLRAADDEFAKWKFALLSSCQPEYLQDSDIVSSCFERADASGARELCLGLEHPENASTDNRDPQSGK